MASNATYPVGTASVSWLDGSGQIQIRVFTTDGYNVTERVMDGANGWTDGTLSQPGSAVSATHWTGSDGDHIRVYCTSEDDTVEWCLDPEKSDWYQGSFTTS